MLDAAIPYTLIVVSKDIKIRIANIDLLFEPSFLRTSKISKVIRSQILDFIYIFTDIYIKHFGFSWRKKPTQERSALI